MIESIVSDQALQVLAMEILAQKGPLPVGEIGKILAELTSIPNLSLKLKEKFGGLKKFLEQYPASFVVSNDHPFNPNVLLRCSLSAEHLELIDKGIFPHQLLIKAKKAAAATAKKKKAHSIPSSNTGNQYNTVGNNMDNHGYRNPNDNMMSGGGMQGNYGNTGNMNMVGGNMNMSNPGSMNMNMGNPGGNNNYRDYRGGGGNNNSHNNMMMSAGNMNMMNMGGGSGSGGNSSKMNMMNMSGSGKGNNNNGLNVVSMGNVRPKSMNMGNKAGMYGGSGGGGNTGGYGGQQDMPYNYHHGHSNYRDMDDHGPGNGNMNSHGMSSGRGGGRGGGGYNNSSAANNHNHNATDFSVSTGNSLLGSVGSGSASTSNYLHTSNNVSVGNTNGSNSSAYFDDFLGNASSADVSAFSNQFLSQLRSDPANVELSPRGYMDNYNPPTRNKSHGGQSFMSNNSFADSMPSLGSNVGHGPGRTSFGSTSDHGHGHNNPSNYNSVIGNLFPLVLSPEEMNSLNFSGGSTANGSGVGSNNGGDETVRDYSSLPPNMF